MIRKKAELESESGEESSDEEISDREREDINQDFQSLLTLELEKQKQKKIVR